MFDLPPEALITPHPLALEHQATAYEVCFRHAREKLKTVFDEPDTHVHPPFLKYDYNMFVHHHH